MSRRFASLRHLGIVTAASAAAIGVLSTPALRAYTLNGGHWANGSYTFYVNPSNPQGMDANTLITALQVAATNWPNQSGANVTPVYGGTTKVATAQYDGVNAVFFRTDSGPYAYTNWWYDSSGRMLDADVAIYAGTATWYTGSSGCSGYGAYIEDILTHEFGHAIGMNHSDVGTATMYPSTPYCSTDLRSLDPDDISGVTALYPPAGTRPAAPSNLTATDSVVNPTSAIDLTWTDNSSNESGYRVDRSLDGLNFTQVAQLGSGVTSFSDSGLVAGGTFYYRVSAYNNAGSSGYSNVASALTAAITTAPSVPSNPNPGSNATGLNTSLTLSWSSSGAQTFDVNVYAGTGTTPVKSFQNLGTASVSVSGLSAGASYSWTVVAKNNIGSTPGPNWAFTTKATRGNSKK